MLKTYMANKETVTRQWYVVDAADKTLGRLASQIASVLRGKHKPTFTPHVDTGDFVIVLNADKIKLTGNKLQNKLYYRHTGYPGGIKVKSAGDILQSKRPEELLEKAVKGMLPHNSLGRQMFKKLRVYAGNEHPHEAQQPMNLDI